MQGQAAQLCQRLEKYEVLVANLLAANDMQLFQVGPRSKLGPALGCQLLSMAKCHLLEAWTILESVQHLRIMTIL